MTEYILFLFLFINMETYMGNYYTLKQKFSTYHECIEYVEQHKADSITGFGEVFTPTAHPPIFEGRIIGLAWCRPIDTSE